MNARILPPLTHSGVIGIGNAAPPTRPHAPFLRSRGQLRSLPPRPSRGGDGELGDAFQLRKLYNEQRLDFEALRGRLLSSSYTPPAGHPGYLPMLRELKRIFDEDAENDSVAIEYDTEIYFGHLAQARSCAE
jgi:hypothetical protein